MGLLDYGYADSRAGLLGTRKNPDSDYINSQKSVMSQPMSNDWVVANQLPNQRIGGDALEQPMVSPDDLIGTGIPSKAAQLLSLGIKNAGLKGVSGLLGAGITKYVRRSQSALSPFNSGMDYAMFAEANKGIADGLDSLSHYGPGKWAATDQYATPVENIQKDILREIRNRGIHTEYNTTAAALARDAAPQNIVDGAGLWDNPDIVSSIYDNVIDRNGIRAVRTPDGLIVFDRDLIKKIR